MALSPIFNPRDSPIGLWLEIRPGLILNQNLPFLDQFHFILPGKMEFQRIPPCPNGGAKTHRSIEIDLSEAGWICICLN
jgi:hypothetical protein